MSTMVTVDGEALYKVLMALDGPDYYIAEMKVGKFLGDIRNEENPLNQLIDSYNEAVYELGKEES